MTLRRAARGDLPAVIALQRAAYAKNRPLLGVEPLPRARELGRTCIRLYTGQPLTFNIAWYTRHGYAHERTEDMGDRVAVHLIKHL